MKVVSSVTDIILIAGIDDGHKLKGYHLAKVDQFAGGRKAVQCDVFMSAVDYLDVDKLLKEFHEIQWESILEVQLMIKGEHDDIFSIHTPGSDS